MKSYDNLEIEQKIYSGINEDGLDAWSMKINGLNNEGDLTNLVIVELAGLPLDEEMDIKVIYRSYHLKKLAIVEKLIEEASSKLEEVVSAYVEKERNK